jgi:hypothetical protein
VQQEEYSYYEVADRICDAINDSEAIYQANLWDKKEGETRVYVFYSNKNKKKDCGYIQVTKDGIYRHLTLQAGTIEEIYSHLKELKIAQPQTLKSNDALTKIVEECWECGAQYTTYGNVESGNMSCRRCG